MFVFLCEYGIMDKISKLYSSKIKFKPRQLRLAVDICN